MAGGKGLAGAGGGASYESSQHSQHLWLEAGGGQSRLQVGLSGNWVGTDLVRVVLQGAIEEPIHSSLLLEAEVLNPW